MCCVWSLGCVKTRVIYTENGNIAIELLHVGAAVTSCWFNRCVSFTNLYFLRIRNLFSDRTHTEETAVLAQDRAPVTERRPI